MECFIGLVGAFVSHSEIIPGIYYSESIIDFGVRFLRIMAVRGRWQRVVSLLIRYSSDLSDEC